MYESCHTYKCVTSHIWMSTYSYCKRTRGSHYMCRGTTMNGSHHTSKWALAAFAKKNEVLSPICVSHVTHINASRHTYEWALVAVAKEQGVLTICVVAQLWMGHITHLNQHLRLLHKTEWGALTHVYESCHAYVWVMSHICMSHVTHVYESCHTCKWVSSHTQISTCSCCQKTRCSHYMSHVTPMSESRHISEWARAAFAQDRTRCFDSYVWVTAHLGMSHGTHMNQSRRSYEWVTSHIWMSHVTHMNQSRHTHARVTSLIWMSHVTHMYESRHTHMNQSRHTYEWALAAVAKTNEVLSIICLSHVIRMHVSCQIYECHVYEWDMSHSYMWHDTCIRVTWLIHMSKSTSFFFATCHTYACVMSHIWIGRVTHM